MASAAEPPPKPVASPTEADSVRAKELFDNGRELYLDASYESAISAFKEAYSLLGDPILLYNIGQSYDRLDEFDQAIEYFEYYRAYAPASERDALTEKVESLRRRKLKAQSEDTGTSDPDGSASDDPTRDNAMDNPAKTGPTDTQRQRIYTPLAIALTSVTAVALGVGIGLGVASSNRKNDAEALCMGGVCPVEAQDDLTASRNMAIGADVSFAVTGAAAAGLITVLVINGVKRKRQTAARAQGDRERFQVRATPHRGGGGLAFHF
jgi:tetratricopeptide (TPR) repeat protein